MDPSNIDLFYQLIMYKQQTILLSIQKIGSIWNLL